MVREGGATRAARRVATRAARRVWIVGLPLVAFATLGVVVAPEANEAAWCQAQIVIALLVVTAAAWASLRGAPDDAVPRRSVCLTLAGLTAGWLAWDAQLLAGWNGIPSPSDAILTASAAYGVLTIARIGRAGLHHVGLYATFLDGATVLGGTLAAYAVFLDQATPVSIPLVPVVIFPPVLMALALTTFVGSLALRLSLRSGAYAVAGGTAIAGLVLVAWAPISVGEGTTIDGRLSHGLTLGFLILGWGFSTLRDEPSRDPRFLRFARLTLMVAPLAAVLFVAGLVALPLQLGPDARVVLGFLLAAVLVLAALRQTLLVVERDVLLRREQAALGREQTAHLEAQANLERATVAEAVQRERAELLTRILGASESLAVTSGAHPYDPALAQIVPDRALGLLARLDEGGVTATLVATHGPGSEGLAGLVLPASVLLAETGEGEGATRDDGALASETSHDPRGTPSPPWLPDLPADEQPSTRLTFGLRDHLGEPLGILHLVDREADRLTDPTFVDLARLVANQLAVAMENARLVDQLGRQVERLVWMQGHLVRTSRLAAIGETASEVAHEVNNPLQGILGYTELLLTSLPPDDRRREDVEVIRAETLRARAFIRSLLVAARVPAAGVPAAGVPDGSEWGRTPGDVVRIVGQAIDAEVRASIGTRGTIRFRRRLRPLPFVNLDPEAMFHALRDLLRHVREAVGGRGIVTIATRLDGDSAVVTIAGLADPEPRGASPPRPVIPPDSTGPEQVPDVTDAVAVVAAHGGTVVLDRPADSSWTATVRLPLARLDPDVATEPRVADPTSADRVDVRLPTSPGAPSNEA